MKYIWGFTNKKGWISLLYASSIASCCFSLQHPVIRLRSSNVSSVIRNFKHRLMLAPFIVCIKPTRNCVAPLECVEFSHLKCTLPLVLSCISCVRLIRKSDSHTDKCSVCRLMNFKRTMTVAWGHHSGCVGSFNFKHAVTVTQNCISWVSKFCLKESDICALPQID